MSTKALFHASNKVCKRTLQNSKPCGYMLMGYHVGLSAACTADWMRTTTPNVALPLCEHCKVCIGMMGVIDIALKPAYELAFVGSQMDRYRQVSELG